MRYAPVVLSNSEKGAFAVTIGFFHMHITDRTKKRGTLITRHWHLVTHNVVDMERVHYLVS